MKVVSIFSASTVIGGALNPIEGLVKGAQLGYTTGASIMGIIGGLAMGAVCGIGGFLGALVGSFK